MRARATAFIEVYYTAFFLIWLFGNVSSKKTPLKDGILSLFTASSSSKLLNGLLGNITFLIDIIFLFENIYYIFIINTRIKVVRITFPLD